MRSHRFGFEFWVELTAEEPGMISDLDDFNEIVVGRGSRYDQAGIFKLLTIGIIEFVSVAMAF